MVERLLFDRVNSQRTGSCIDLADKNAFLIAAAATDTGLAVGNATMVWTELTFYPSTVQPLIISALHL